ncbi:MAG: hypothetical protein JWP04_3877, partial [Belnapia sp.]|nr:hypothetical protein [Belnapia sp.]
HVTARYSRRRALAVGMQAMNELLTMLPWVFGLVAAAAAITQSR